ncbi:hypothetical protein [Bacillus tuaregi]|uniref:hypothetical protein n=1 Tax=Bacillus tuaregi TaxID=1816695 RepID=UPI0008F8FBED|nr:hypothetical protein [Bacillus tuaregi]
MKVNTKAKWIVGITGAAFSAFILSTLDEPAPAKQGTLSAEINDNMSEREKELVQLDWSDFTPQISNDGGNSENDRNTRRSARD